MSHSSYLEVSGYYEIPIKGPSAAFAAVYATITAVYIFQNTKYKSWKLLWLLPCTFIIFTAGFVCREITAHHAEASSSPYSATQGLLYSGVCVLTASIFLILSYLVYKFPHVSPFPTTWLPPLFSLLMTVTISLTAQGTSTFFNPGASGSTISSGLAVLKAGVVLQLVFTVGLLGILHVFHHRYPGAHSTGTSWNRKVKSVVYSLYAVAVLLLIRNVFRTVQIFSSSQSRVWSEEVFFWVFDAVPLLVCALILTFGHAGRLLLTEGLQTSSNA